MLTQLREHHITTIDWKGIMQREAVTEGEGPPQMCVLACVGLCMQRGQAHVGLQITSED